MQKFLSQNTIIFLVFIVILFLDLFYLLNRDWFIFIPLIDNSTTIASITKFSWINNFYFIFINISLFFILFLFINKNSSFLKKRLNFELSTYLSFSNLILVICIIITLSLPYSNPIRIGNFGDVFHDSEKIAFLPYIYESFSGLEILKNVFTLHGWFQDLFISILSYSLYGYEKIIFGLRSIISVVNIITALSVILLIYSFVKNFIKSNYYTFILFLTCFAVLQYSNITSVIDRHFFLYIILILYLNFNYDIIKSKINDVIISISAALIIATFFYNFYQFVSLFILNLTAIFFISIIYNTRRFILVYFLSLAFLSTILLLFIDIEVFKIGFFKIIELITWGGSKPIFDMRFGYRISNGILLLFSYVAIIAFIFINIFIEIRKNFNREKIIESINVYLKKNILLFILLIFSLSGFYEFLVRGHCCYIHRANLIHFLIFGFLILRFLNESQIKILALSFPLLFCIIIFSDVNFKKRVYYNALLLISHINIEDKKDETLLYDNLGIFEVVEKIKEKTKDQDCFYSYQDDAFLQVKLNKIPCTSNPISQDLRSQSQLIRTIDELRISSPQIILFDIDNYSEFYSLGLRAEDNVRSTIYSDLILDYLLRNYSPYISYNGYHIWQKNSQDKKSIYINTPSIKSLLNMVPTQICSLNNISSNCFVAIRNKDRELYIDVLDGNINDQTIEKLMSLDQKHYFMKNFPKIDELSLIEDNDEKIEIILITEKENVYINKK